MNFVVVAFYTTGNGYDLEAHRLRKSLEYFGLPHVIRAIKDRGSWTANTGFKAQFIAESLESIGCPVLYVDADAVFRQSPVLIGSMKCDFACHFRHRPFGEELLGGTLYFNTTIEAADVVKLWVKKCAENPKTWDQKNLQAAIEEYSEQNHRFTIKRLPVEYCQIFDAPEQSEYPVIEHLQASRRLK